MTIEREIEQYAAEADKPALLWLFEHYSMASVWRVMAKCEHRRYGTQSYETRRVWSPTEVGRALFAKSLERRIVEAAADYKQALENEGFAREYGGVDALRQELFKLVEEWHGKL